MNLFQRQLLLNGKTLEQVYMEDGKRTEGFLPPPSPRPCTIEDFEKDMREVKDRGGA